MIKERYRILLNYGLIAPLVSFILFLIYFILGFNPLGNISWISVWVLPAFVYLGVKKHRDEKLDGYVTYWKALLYSLLIVLMYAVIFDLLAYLFGMLIDQSFVEASIEQAKEGMEQARQYLDEETYQKALAGIDKITLETLVFSDFRSKILGGIIVSLVVAGILKKKRPLYEIEEDAETEDVEDVKVIEEKKEGNE